MHDDYQHELTHRKTYSNCTIHDTIVVIDGHISITVVPLSEGEVRTSRPCRPQTLVKCADVLTRLTVLTIPALLSVYGDGRKSESPTASDQDGRRRF